ncbi:MAG: hypothetical protein E6J02_14045 [Chloroflexi bacterium]|nr:MAG: hypothetical protein E6J02_14045 [Chloroflexota bacterium]
MNYGYLIKRAFDIVARRPYLWLLGFLAGGATTFNFPNSNYSRPTASGAYHGPNWAVLQNFWNDNWLWIAGIFVFVAILGIVLFVLGCIAAGGVIHAAVEHDAGHEYRLGKAWRAGYATAWRIAGLRLLTFVLAILPGLLVGALVLAAVAGATSSAAAGLSFGLLAAMASLVSIAFWLTLGVSYELAKRLIVLEDGRVAESLRNGFGMIRRHFKEVVFGWLILIALSIGVGIAMVVLAAVVAIPAVALGFGSWAIGGATGLIVIGSFAAVFALGVLLAAHAAYSSYSSVYWTLLFRSIRTLPEPTATGAIVPAA